MSGMKAPITQKILMDWAGPRVYHDGKALFEDHIVERVEYDPPIIRGTLSYGSSSITCQLTVHPDGSAENHCPCRDSSERGIICSHVVALGMELIRRQTDPERERKAREEMRRAARLANHDESRYLKRAAEHAPGATPARLQLVLERNWRERSGSGRFPLQCLIEYENRRSPINAAPEDTVFALSRQDENILFVVEDICEGPARDRIEIPTADLINILNIHAGKPLMIEGADTPATVNAAKMASVLRMDLDRETGELILMIHTELPFSTVKEFPTYVVAGRNGWVYHAGHFWPLENLLPLPLHTIYEKPVVVPRSAVPRFFETELAVIETHLRVETEITRDLFTIEAGTPAFSLEVRGSPASLSATLRAHYNGISLTAGKADPAGHFAIPDAADIMRYTVRNPGLEHKALAQLAELGLQGECGDALSPIVGCREVLNFLASTLPRLRRMGWRVELAGRIQPFMEELDFATPVVRLRDSSDHSVFEIGFNYEDRGGQSLSEAEIQRALLKNEYFVEKDGRTILVDADAIRNARDVFADCATGEGSQPGTFRLSGIYSAYVLSSLDALDGIDVEAPPTWASHARRQNRNEKMAPEPLDAHLESVLRPYQKQGVYWLRFLERTLTCGILADDMGLGKTLQTLTWIQLQRAHPEAAGKPALIVCPTSLVENWAEEAARFTPELRVLILSGAERHERRAGIADADLVITSYALMRRDIENYTEIEFAAVVLDEAQHIKNRSTQNALAAKKLKGHHRIVLTGTPIENSVSDLWSIMDFLMPGYLGSAKLFRENYELPISNGTPEGEVAQARLRRKLHPFLLRRLKTEVAKDLPPKIEKLASCSLTRDQQLVYKQLLESSRRKLADMVAAQGFERSRMEVLKTLLRLRQTCCHLELLKLSDLQSEYPSAKMDLFFELLDEAIDGGHRVLVFSQFTSMLAILRRELEARERAYCYLDGATKERLKVVREFNMNRAIPVFLISLKAGGTGLNLVGADTVIHFDPWWNPAVEDQATDRAHRIGQQRTVYSIKMITKGTVEEKVLAMQKRKKEIINATLSKDEQVMEKLTWEDVQALLEA